MVFYFLSVYFILHFLDFLKKKIRIFGEYGPIFSRETYKVVDESLKSIKDIKLRKNYSFFSTQILKKLNKYASNGVKFDFYSSIPRTITEIIGFGSILLIAIFLIVKSNYKIEETVVTLGVYLLALQRLIPVVQNLFIQISTYKLYSPTFASIYDDLLDSNFFTQKDENSTNNNFIDKIFVIKLTIIININWNYFKSNFL